MDLTRISLGVSVVSEAQPLRIGRSLDLDQASPDRRMRPFRSAAETPHDDHRPGESRSPGRNPRGHPGSIFEAAGMTEVLRASLGWVVLRID